MTVAVLELDAGFMVGGSYAYVGINLVGDGSVAAPDSMKQDITAYGRDSGWSTARGSTTGVTAGFVSPGGTLNSTLDNRDRRFDPNYTAGPYNTQVKRGVPIFLYATYGSQYSIFQGFADAWPQTYPSVGVDQTVALAATDGTARMANAGLDISRPIELTGARIQAVLNAVGYTGAVSISPGAVFVSALTQQSSTSTVSAWSHLTDVVMCEGGELYFDDDNTLIFRDRNLIQSETRSRTPQATFGDQGSELRFSDVKMGSPPIINQQTITWSAIGAKVNAADGVSQRAYWGLQAGPPLALPFASAVDAQALASWIVGRFAQEVTTFVSVSFKPARDPSHLWAQALGRKLGDLITVKLTPQGPGSRLSANCLIRGIHHDYHNHDWTTTFYLQDASWLANIAIVGTNLVGDGSVIGF